MAQKVTQTQAILMTDHEGLETAYELIHIGSDIIGGWSKYHQEMISFHSKHILESLQFQQKLMGCKSFHEVCDLGWNFFETSSKQYSDEVQKLAKLGQHILPTELTGVNDQINQ